MDQVKTALQCQVDKVVNDPMVPDNIKTMIQNFAGAQYYTYGISMATLYCNQNNTLSPFAMQVKKED